MGIESHLKQQYIPVSAETSFQPQEKAFQDLVSPFRNLNDFHLKPVGSLTTLMGACFSLTTGTASKTHTQHMQHAHMHARTRTYQLLLVLDTIVLRNKGIEGYINDVFTLVISAELYGYK